MQLAQVVYDCNMAGTAIQGSSGRMMNNGMMDDLATLMDKAVI
jgi:hypothetical protein